MKTTDHETVGPVREGGIASQPLPLSQPMPLLPFQGIVPPVITPLNADETLDEPAFRKLLEKFLATDTLALFLCGTAGLGPALTDSVYSHVLGSAVQITKGKVPLLAGVMEPSTGRCIDRLKRAEAEGLQFAVVSVPYFFVPRTAEEFTTHFEACALASSMTILAYNLPQYTRASIPIEVLLDLWSRGQISGVKESSGDPVYFEDLCLRGSACGLPIFQGNRPDFSRLIELGASGAVPVPANADPNLYVQAWKAATAQDGSLPGLQAQTDALWAQLVQGSDFLSGILQSLHGEGIGQQLLPQPWILNKT